MKLTNQILDRNLSKKINPNRTRHLFKQKNEEKLRISEVGQMRYKISYQIIMENIFSEFSCCNLEFVSLSLGVIKLMTDYVGIQVLCEPLVQMQELINQKIPLCSYEAKFSFRKTSILDINNIIERFIG
jgi:hypothetical protein